jgi:hypothetical protein
MTLAAVGGGAWLLRIVGVIDEQSALEKWAWSFALGVGVIGWSVFFFALAGKINTPWLIGICLVLISGIVFLRPSFHNLKNVGNMIQFRLTWPMVLIIGIIVALSFDLLEGLAPPTDGDSLAYHFALPKLFLNFGELVFVPRANDGAVPLLQQMTFLMALKLGGEQGLTLWAMLSSWGACLVLFAILRRHVQPTFALATALVFLTTPAVVYSGGSGQVEIRNAMFVVVAAVAVGDALRTGQWRYAVLAGLAAGFYVGSKYPGLLFAFTCAVGLMFQRRWLSHGLGFTLAVIIAGGQWYAWNWWNTGDPVFPLLYSWVEYVAGFPWNEAQNAFYQSAYTGSEEILAVNPLTAFIYPFMATLMPYPSFEASTVGFGPIVLLLLPMALLGAWWHREKILRSPVLVYTGMCLLGYLLWFFLGPSQRIRFYAPIYPLLLIIMAVGVARASEVVTSVRAPICLAFACALFFQGAGHFLYSINFMKRIALAETRDTFLARMVGRYPAIQYVNRTLTTNDMVLLPFRELVYLADVPIFYSHPVVEARVETRPNSKDYKKFWKQLNAWSVTHILDTPGNRADESNSSLPSFIVDLLERSCVSEIKRIQVFPAKSRSLPTVQRNLQDNVIYSLTPKTCRI